MAEPLPRLQRLRDVRRPAGRDRQADLVVVVNGFPRLSETFVLHELLELERQGVRLHLVALRRPEEAVQLEAVARLQAGVEYLPETFEQVPQRLLRIAQAVLFVRRPLAYLNAVADVLSAEDFSKGTFRRALLLAHRIVRLGAPALYVQFAHKPATVGRFAALLAGVPYALSAHAKDIWLTPREELAEKVRDARVVLTCTAEGFGHLRGLAGTRTPVHLVHHGVELPERPRPSPGNDVPVVLSVGRLVAKKGHATLLTAAALLAERGVDFSLRIGGEGPEWPVLQRLVHRLGLADRVTFLGPLSESEVRAEHGRADVFALASQPLENGDRDGIPNVLLEAMAQGIPVVGTAVEGVTEAVVDGECGLLAPPGDAEAVADRLARLLADERLRTALGAAGREQVARSFDRAENLPTAVDVLRAAGIVETPVPGRRADEAVDLRAVA
jgi:glycosyltransferase involved in cell wall biosynthesis